MFPKIKHRFTRAKKAYGILQFFHGKGVLIGILLIILSIIILWATWYSYLALFISTVYFILGGILIGVGIAIKLGIRALPQILTEKAKPSGPVSFLLGFTPRYLGTIARFLFPKLIQRSDKVTLDAGQNALDQVKKVKTKTFFSRFKPLSWKLRGKEKS